MPLCLAILLFNIILQIYLKVLLNLSQSVGQPKEMMSRNQTPHHHHPHTHQDSLFLMTRPHGSVSDVTSIVFSSASGHPELLTKMWVSLCITYIPNRETTPVGLIRSQVSVKLVLRAEWHGSLCKSGTEKGLCLGSAWTNRFVSKGLFSSGISVGICLSFLFFKQEYVVSFFFLTVVSRSTNNEDTEPS